MPTTKDSMSNTLQILEHPSEQDIKILWDARLSASEDIPYAFADASPTMDGFIKGIENEEIICKMTKNDNGEFISAIWLHDLEKDYDGCTRIGWIGAYGFPKYRGKIFARSIRELMEYLESTGIKHIHTAIHAENRRSIAFARNRSAVGMTYVCRYPDWTKFGGKMADALIMTKNEGDKMLAWLCAQKLASKRLLSQP